MRRPPALVLFDMDDVLCGYDRDRRVRILSHLTHRSPEAILFAIWGSGFEAAADSGRFDAGAYLDGFGARLGYPLSRETWIAARRAAMTAWPAVLTLAARVREKAKIAVLTNNGVLLEEAIDELFPELRPLFGDAILVSGRFSTRKPDPDIYRRACTLLGASPEQAFFTDDKPWHVAGAEQAGLTGHVFTGAPALERALGLAGLLG